jgi:hypothetical protein
MWCVVILLVLCCMGSIGSYLWLSTFPEPYSLIPFLNNDETRPNATAMLSIFCVFIIILQVRVLSLCTIYSKTEREMDDFILGDDSAFVIRHHRNDEAFASLPYS